MSTDSDSDTALGDWYVNRIVVNRTPLLLLVSSRSLFPLLIPARDVRSLPDRLPELVGNRLARIGVSSALIEAELKAMAPVLVQKTINRAVVGILVDYAKSVPYCIDGPASNNDVLADVEDQLEENPCFAGRRFDEVVFPREKTIELLAERWGSSN